MYGLYRANPGVLAHPALDALIMINARLIRFISLYGTDWAIGNASQAPYAVIQDLHELHTPLLKYLF
jgi:hypothetical protein